MRSTLKVTLFCFVGLIVFILVDYLKASDEHIAHHRPKRFLSFRNISRFYIKVDWKNNLVAWNQFFAQAYGFRVAWDDPPDTFHPYRHFSRRSVYHHLETLLDRQGLNGFHCVRRAICEAKTTEPNGIYAKILKMVFGKQSTHTEKWHNATTEECEISLSSCPFSLLHVSKYTDI